MSHLPLGQLRAAEQRYEALVALMGDPQVATDPARIRDIGLEQAELESLVSAYRSYRSVATQLDEVRAWLATETDPAMSALAEAEVEALGDRSRALEAAVVAQLAPADPDDRRDVIVEIRAGTGGVEAGLFAGDLYRMYERYAEAKSWRVNVISRNATDLGGFREIVFEVEGRGAYSRLKWESGVHRVQRVPDTEASGRIHTSTATVAVLPEIEEVEVDIPDQDVRIDVFRSSGPGGQSVNTTDSAVRLTHLPTGLVISCQDEKSQLQNRRKAYQVLRARLYQIESDRRLAAQGAERRSQVGSGERAEKIRTYNFPQNRVTDHRLNLTVHHLEGVLGGGLDPFIEALQAADHDRRLQTALDDQLT